MQVNPEGLARMDLPTVPDHPRFFFIHDKGVSPFENGSWVHGGKDGMLFFEAHFFLDKDRLDGPKKSFLTVIEKEKKMREP